MHVPPMCWELEQRIRLASYRDWLRRNYSETYLKKHYPELFDGQAHPS